MNGRNVRLEDAVFLVDLDFLGLLEKVGFHLGVLGRWAVQIDHHVGHVGAIGHKAFVGDFRGGANGGVLHGGVALGHQRGHLRSGSAQNDLALDRAGLG